MNDQTSTRIDSLKESMRSLIDMGSDSASAFKDKMSDVKDTVVAGSKTGITKMGSLIKAHPILAIGVAFGLGYLVMRIARR